MTNTQFMKDRGLHWGESDLSERRGAGVHLPVMLYYADLSEPAEKGQNTGIKNEWSMEYKTQNIKVYIHVTVHRNRFSLKQPTRRTNYPIFILL
jgi:hypothetical protein